MACSQCIGIEEEFNPKVARRQLKKYRRRGPKRTTRWLVDAIRERGVRGRSLLDIGGGVGEIQHELAEAGAGRITGVDASSAYLEQCREEAKRRGYDDRASYRFGNFTDVHEEVEAADIVTLDRVICCFDDADLLVGRSVVRAHRLYGLVFPRETLANRIAFRLINGMQRLRKANFFVYLHSSDRVDDLITRRGFKRAFHRAGFVWQVVLYEAQ